MNQMNLQFRLYNDAIEPYINYGNYRISYYLYDPTITCLSGADGCNSGWGITNGDIQGGDPNTIKVPHDIRVTSTFIKAVYSLSKAIGVCTILHI